MTRVIIAAILFGMTLVGVASATNPVPLHTDVLVYGATPGGIVAAVSAAKAGHSVALVEPTDRVGGLLTSGLSYTDFRSFESLTGFFFDFSQRVQADYERRYGKDSEQAKASFRGTHGEPSVKLYIREARRLVGQHVFTEKDTRQVDGDARAVLHTDSVAIGDYVHNCHGTGRIGSRFDGEHSGEFYKPVPPYQIPYGVIVPQKTENLLIPVACSASHFGFGALRLEPIWCSLGQAAGWAATESLKANVPVLSIDVQQLQRRLHTDRSATIYVSDVPATSSDFAAVQWWGTRGGLHGLALPDQPKPTSLGGQYNGAFPGHFLDAETILSDELRTRWNGLLPDGIEPPKQSTRLDWINAAYGTSKH